MRVLGVDPGSKSGAWALLYAGTPLCGDLPNTKDGVNGAEFRRMLSQLKPDVAVVERVGAMPHQGVSSVWSFGKSYGIILGVLAASEIPVELITPTVWKKHYALPGKDKEAARQKAIELFPGVTGLSRKMDHGRGEALLLAKYFWEKKHAAAKTIPE